MVKPFKRPSIDLDTKVARTWQTIEAADVSIGDTVANYGLVKDKAWRHDEQVILTLGEHGSLAFPPHAQLKVFHATT